MATQTNPARMLPAQLQSHVKVTHDMDVDVRYLRQGDGKLSPDALYLVSEARKLRANAGGLTLLAAVRRVWGECVGCPLTARTEAMRYMGA
jgi:hypothetical protein